MSPEVLVALASLSVSAVALSLSGFAYSRASDMSRSNLFLALRSKFNEIYAGLPQGYRNPEWRAKNEEEKQAVRKYWHHCFDEWYLTTRLNKKYMHKLWNDYLADGVTAGTRYDGLWEVLNEMSNFEHLEKKKLWKEFYATAKDLRENIR